MLKLILNMLKEEWRMQTIWVDERLFMLFPLLMIGVISILFTILQITGFLISGTMLIIHLGMLVAGFSSGLINFFRRAVIERQTSQVNLFYTCTHLLPLKQESVMLAFMIREFAFLQAFLIIPLVIAASLTGGANGLDLGISTSLSFILGMSAGFAFYGVYNKVGRISILALILIFWLTGLWRMPYDFFVTLTFNRPNWELLGYILTSSIIFALSAIFLTDFYIEFKGFPVKDFYSKLQKYDIPDLFSKDVIGLYRTAYYLFMIFYVIVLGGIFWIIIRQIFPIPFLGFAVGLFSMASWFVVHFIDEVNSYLHLPINLDDFFLSKFYLFLIINTLLSLLLFWIVCLVENQMSLLLITFLLFLGTSFYTIGMVTFLVNTNLSKLLQPITWSISLGLLIPTFLGMLITLLTMNLLIAVIVAILLVLAGALMLAIKLETGIYKHITG